MISERMANRILLAWFNDLRGIPQSLEEASNYLSARVRKPSGAETEKAVEFLTQAGYLEHAERTAADPQLWKITAAGMRQISKQVPAAQLDPMIWD